MISPKRGEIWLVQLDPTRGQEIQKTRPAVVISSELFALVNLSQSATSAKIFPPIILH